MEKRDTVFVDGILEILTRHKKVAASEAATMKKAFYDSASEQFDQFLLDEGLVEKENLLQALGEFYRVPPVDVEGLFFDHILVIDFPKDFLLRNEVIPWQVDNDMLIVIAGNPSIEGLEHAVRKFSSYDIDFMVGLGRDIIDAVEEFYDVAVTEDIPEDMDLDQERRLQEEAEELEERDHSISKINDDL